jgi:peptidoglycan hydrolase-like amidase
MSETKLITKKEKEIFFRNLLANSTQSVQNLCVKETRGTELKTDNKILWTLYFSISSEKIFYQQHDWSFEDKTNYKGTDQNHNEDAAKVVKLKQMQLIKCN